jgi:hypothetical protein
MIQSLLETREALFEIAFELYGEAWVASEKFWGSPTERELTETQDRLYDLGYEDPAPSKEEIKAAKKLAKKLRLDL